MGPNEKQKIEIEKLHRDPLPPLNQAVTADYLDFLGTALRDTFAVELLLAGVPLERVSILLGHQSVRITEKYYAAWTDSRQRQVEADLRRAWEHDPIVLLEAKATRRLRGKSEAVN